MLNPVPLFGIGNKAKSVVVSAQERLNVYVELNDDPEKQVITMYPRPGLVSAVDFGAFPIRGMWQKGDFLYVVQRDSLYRVANDGSTLLLGTLLTNSGRVDISDNGVQLIVVDGPYGYIYLFSPTARTISSITRVTTTATLTTAQAHGLMTGMQVTVSGATPSQYNGTFTITVTGANTFTYVMGSDPGSSASPVGSYTVSSGFARITDPDFPGASTVTFLNQRFIVNEPSSGRFFWSALIDGSSWDALDFATAEASPDDLVRVFAEAGQLYLFGDTTTEVWGDSGAADKAFVKIGGGAVEWGLAARWSLVKYADSMAFLRKNRLGQVQVCVMAGSVAQPISNPQVEVEFTSYGDVSNATALAYMVNGHAFYQINFPTVGKTWMYDAQSKAWSVLESFGGMHRASMSAQLLGNIYAADFGNGKLYTIEPDVLTDDGQPMVREFTARHQSIGDFTRVAELWLEMQPGVGNQTGLGVDPQVMMKVSRDGGNTYGNELWTSIGKVGEYKNRAVWRRLGQARDWVMRFRVTDPVVAVFVAAWARVVK